MIAFYIFKDCVHIFSSGVISPFRKSHCTTCMQSLSNCCGREKKGTACSLVRSGLSSEPGKARGRRTWWLYESDPSLRGLYVDVCTHLGELTYRGIVSRFRLKYASEYNELVPWWFMKYCKMVQAKTSWKKAISKLRPNLIPPSKESISYIQNQYRLILLMEGSADIQKGAGLSKALNCRRNHQLSSQVTV